MKIFGYGDLARAAFRHSAQYYWALTGMDLIFVPCSEPLHLLGLADLYHERRTIEVLKKAFGLQS